jgi:3-oxoacyl-[acyl-carrier-protein] synthase-3
MPARIRHIEYVLPDQVVTNEDLQRQHPDWNVALAASKTGVLSRRIAAEGELASDLAYRAAVRVFEETGITPDAIDGLLFCTQSPDYIMPPNATLLHARLNLPTHVVAFDITLACSGFVYGLAIAQALMDSLGLRNVLLVTADTYSRYIHPGDRSALTWFGDGAAVTLLQPADRDSEIKAFSLETDGQGGNKFWIEAGGLRTPRSDATATVQRDIAGNLRSRETICMDGRAVLEFAEKRVPCSVREVLGKSRLVLQDLNLVLFHQASALALKKLHELIEVAPEQQFTNIAHVGNTVSASLPILLKDAERAGRLRRGDLVLLVGFGVGFSWGSCVLRW